jgi:hypothetical protein
MAAGQITMGRFSRSAPAGVFTLLKSLAAHPDGAYPVSALTVGADGNLYGTNSGGGLYNGRHHFSKFQQREFTHV